MAASSSENAVAAWRATHGGRRQRLSATSVAAAPHRTSHLVNALLELWSEGQLPAVAVQHLASQAVLDGLEDDEVKKLSVLGAGGYYSNNVNRDLVRSLKTSYDNLPPTDSFRVPVRDSRQSHPVIVTIAVQYPHDVFSHYSQPGRENQFRMLFGNPTEISKYWSQKDVNDPGFRESLLPIETNF
eukprot:6492152-Amphidinium_carterae.2